MRKLIKDSQGNIGELVLASDIDFMPEGWSEVPAEELEAEELALARRNKMAEIRLKRDVWLLVNDKEWLIKSKKQESTVALEADAEALRDLPEAAQAAVDAMSSPEDIRAYDAFSGLSLSMSYE